MPLNDPVANPVAAAPELALLQPARVDVVSQLDFDGIVNAFVAALTRLANPDNQEYGDNLPWQSNRTF